MLPSGGSPVLSDNPEPGAAKAFARRVRNNKTLTFHGRLAVSRRQSPLQSRDGSFARSPSLRMDSGHRLVPCRMPNSNAQDFPDLAEHTAEDTTTGAYGFVKQANREIEAMDRTS